MGALQQLHRAVLSPVVSRDDIDDAMARAGLSLTNVIPSSETIPAQLVFGTRGGAVVYVIEDARLGVLYVAATGADAAAELARLGRELPFLGDDDHTALDAALAREPADPEEVVLGLATLIFSAAPHAPAALERLARALAHPNTAVRGRALVAVTYAPSRALYKPLAAIRDADPEPELRAQAGRVLELVLRPGGRP